MDPAEQSPAPQPVVAVVVTHDAPGDRLDQVLRALAGQTHPNLDVLVVDTGTDDPTGRVADHLPAARVHRVAGNPGFGAAANVVLDIVSGAGFYVFCHDDAVPDPGAVAGLVAAAEQWDADVVGPKLVEWDDPQRFAQFGLSVDAVGVPLPLVERGELDQGQHDGVRDVFAAPGAFTLVRAERFAELGGFDEAITFLGDDLSLSWRARIAGARVLVTSAARVRHAEAFAARPEGGGAGRLAARHRLRVVLTSYGRLSLLRVVPQALALTVVDVIGAVVTGRPGRARAALGAWPWNLWRLPSLLAARREVALSRVARDRDVRRYQVRGLLGPRLALRRAGGDGRAAGRRHGPGWRRVAAVPERGHMTVDPAAWSPTTAVVAACVAAVVAFGSRHLLTRGVPAVGEMVPVGGGAHDLLGAWAGGWRPVGLGADAATPALAGAFGLLGTVLGGQLGLVRTLVTVGLVPLGIVGAHRLAAPTGAKRAQVAAAVAYAAVPLPYDALAAGRWSALAAYAAAPWMLGRLARASGIAPFAPHAPLVPPGSAGSPGDPAAPAIERRLPAVPGDGGGGPDGAEVAAPDPVEHHPLWMHVVATGAVTALAGLLVPQAPALLLVMGGALVVGSLLVGQLRGTGRLVVVSVGGAAVAVALGLPTAVGALSSPGGLDAWLGADRRAAGVSATDLLALRTGPTALAGVALALLAAASAPLLVGRGWRLAWAARGWSVAAAVWALVWAGEQGWVTVRLPDAGVLLAPAAAGLALAVALGMAAVDHDVRGRSWRFGLRRIVVAVASLALVASTASVVVASLDGWWDMPRDDFAGLLGFVDDDVRAVPSRVLWVGDTEMLPGGDGWDLDDDLSYTASTGSVLPGVADLWPAMGDGASPRLGEALELALARDTTRLGRLLAPMGVQYVAVPQRLAPSDDTGRGPADSRVDAHLVDVLAGQLDLEQVRVDRGIVLYRNTAFVPLRAAAGDAPLDETSVAALGGVDLAGTEALLDDGSPDDARAARGTVPAGETVVQASTASDAWQLTVDGRAADHGTAYGWADTFTSASGGPASLTYRTPAAARALVAAQAVLWLLVLGVALRMRFGPGERPAAPRRPERGGGTASSVTPAAGAGATGDAVDAPGDPLADPDGTGPDADVPHRPLPGDEGAPAPGPSPAPGEPPRAPSPDRGPRRVPVGQARR